MKLKLFLPSCLVLAISICLVGAAISVAVHADTLPASKPLKVPLLKYESYKLANGLQVLTHEDHRLPLVAIDVWYHVGPANEKVGRTGFAHLFEHMMFEGSEHVGEKAHFRYLEGAGATDINGTTNFDRTNYFETLPSNQLELGLWLESDRMGFLLETLDRAKLANQRDVVRNERRQSFEGSPYGLGDEAVFHLLFPERHPYYAEIIGSHADIEAARLSDIRDFFQHYYTPNNASIAIAGDFDPAKLKALLEKYFGPIPHGPEVDTVEVGTPSITQEKRVTITDTVQLPRVSVAWLAPRSFTPGDADADLFTQILGGGKSSRLYRKLVYEQQVAQSADCSQYPLKIISVVSCDVVARPGVKPEALEAAIDREIEALRSSGPASEEVEQVKTGTLTGKINGLQRLGGFGGVADVLDRYNQYLGDPGYLPKDIARYQAVTPASILKLSQQYFAKNQRVVVYTIPGKKVVDDVPRSPSDTDASVKIVPPYSAAFEAAQQWRNAAPPVGPETPLHLPAPKIFALANGMHVYLLEEHALPFISASVVNLAGSDANPDKPGLAAFTAALLTEGTRDRSSVQLAKDAAKIGATLTSSATMDNARAAIESLSNNIDAAMDLLADVTLHPAFKAEEVERVRKQQLTSILQEGNDPFDAAVRVGRKTLYGNYPYGYLDVGTTNSVTAITRDDLAQFWSAHYAPGNAALLLAGDLTEAEAKRLADKYFGAWTAKEKVESVSVPPAPPPPGRKIVIVDKPGSPQTTLIAFGMGMPRSSPEYPATNVMNNLLGGLFSSRINMNLREKNGYTYGGFSHFRYYRAGGFFSAGAQVRTDVSAPAMKELFAELNRIRTDPPAPEELKRATDYALRSLPGDFETVEATSQLMSSLFTYKLPADYYQLLPSKYLALTPDAVEKAALNYVHPENLVVIAVGDRSKIEAGIEKLDLGPIEVRDESGDLAKK